MSQTRPIDPTELQRTGVFLRCAVCNQEARRLNATQKLCGRRECKIVRDRQNWHAKKGTYGRNRPGATPPMAAPYVNARCACGVLLSDWDFEVDRTGRTVVVCPQCGASALPQFGVVTYPQRKDLEDEITASIARAQAPAEPKKSEAGKAGKSWQQNFQVIGRDLQREIDVA